MEVSRWKLRGRLGLLAGVLALTGVCGTAQGQAQLAKEGELMVTLNVGYNLSYRDQSWVPVDVLVNNNDRDIEGFVEVKCFGYSPGPQSPTYRVPATSPKGSIKLFRVYCYLDSTTRVETRVYDGQRPADLVPSFLETQAIAPEDRMAIILDEVATDYAFVNVALQQQDEKGRFYRDQIRGSELGRLADYLPCYDPYNTIIMGDINPRAVPPKIQAILGRYVQQGGQLIVCLGDNAAAYRGSWVESLAGVTIGDSEPMTGDALAAAVFASGEERVGALAERQGRVARLQPGAGVESIGGEVTLMTRRKVGTGAVITVAIDAQSKLLQDTPGYQRLWGNLCRYEPPRLQLKFAEAAQQYTYGIGHASGIQLYSKAAVLRYLALYFFIGIVLNGAVCYFLKRREMVWPVLVVVSLGFTAYAMIFGTAGRARSSQWHQIDVAVASPGAETASVHTLASLLTARTTNQAMRITSPELLARDYKSFSLADNISVLEGRPFVFVQGNAPGLLDFHVGASEVRPIVFEGEVTMGGGFDGGYTMRGARPEIDVVNNTGLGIGQAVVFYGGQFWSARERNGRLTTGSQVNGFGRGGMRLEDLHERYVGALLGTAQQGDWRYGMHDGTEHDPISGVTLVVFAALPPSKYVELDRPVDEEKGTVVILVPLQETQAERQAELALDADGRMEVPVVLSQERHRHAPEGGASTPNRIIDAHSGAPIGIRMVLPFRASRLAGGKLMLDVKTRTRLMRAPDGTVHEGVIFRSRPQGLRGRRPLAPDEAMDPRWNPTYTFGPYLSNLYDPEEVAYKYLESEEAPAANGMQEVVREHAMHFEVDGNLFRGLDVHYIDTWVQSMSTGKIELQVDAHVELNPDVEETTSWQSSRPRT